jgi:hypothetical protein
MRKKKLEKQTAASRKNRNNGVRANGRSGAEHRGLEPANPEIPESPRSSAADCGKTSPRREPPPSSDGPLKIKTEGDFTSLPSWAAVARTFGTSDGDLSAELLLQVTGALPKKKLLDPGGNHALAALFGISPRDAIEGMVSTQMVADHNLGMEFLRRAALQGQRPGGMEFNVNLAIKLQRACLAIVRLLDRRRLVNSPGCEAKTCRAQHSMSGARNACRPKSHEEFLTNPRE